MLGGGGAMGGLLGGYLARSGLDVSLIDVRPDTVAAINDGALTITEADGSQSPSGSVRRRTPPRSALSTW